MEKRKYTRELLEKVIPKARSFENALKIIGTKLSGGSQNLIKARTVEYGIDYSHFTSLSSNSGVNHVGGPQKKKWQDVLVLRDKNSTYRREQSFRLRRALIEMGRIYKCEDDSCSVTGIWNDKKIILHVDHINRNYWDCQPTNLRFLCPNCHSQTKGHSNSKGYTDVITNATSSRMYRKRKKAQVGK